MPIYEQSQLENIAAVRYGIRVEAAEALVTGTPGRTIFTVTGGNVILTAFYGEVKVLFPAGACTLSLVHTPTVGALSTIAEGVTDIAAAAAGMMMALPAALAGGLTLTATAYGVPLERIRYVLRPGVMSIFGSIAPATGTIAWTMFYVPADYGAYVTGV
jgi:hypothetical protein